MNNIFTQIQMTRPPFSQKDLSHSKLLSCNMGTLIPVMWIDAIPGDRFKCSIESLQRMLPMVTPPIGRVNVTYHTYFVPKRLLWAKWESWVTNSPIPPATILPAHPTITLNPATSLEPLFDYLGIPDPFTIPGASAFETVSAMPMAAYQLIYNEYYRDQNLVDPLINPQEFMLADGDNTAIVKLYLLRKRAWNHDYFTSCLPWAQKGQAVSMPFNFTDVPIAASNVSWPPPITGLSFSAIEQPGGTPVSPAIGTATPVVTPADLFAQTSTLAGSSTLNDLRVAEALQKWAERMARGGSRYTEFILNNYGVRSSDGRLNRPEYISGLIQAVTISEVLQTSSTDATSPQGEMAGHGIAAINGGYGNYFCEEFGIIMTIMNIQPVTQYFQGINRAWLKYSDPSEITNPLFAHLGEQEVKVRELYAYDASSDDIFGYLPRYAEESFQPSTIHGQMRTTLKHWHWAREFATPPALNQTFIEADPTFRPFAVTTPTEDHIICHVFNKIKAERPLPKYATPMLT